MIPESGISGPVQRAIIKTGTYTGNGADNRNIDIGVNLSSKSNVFVMVKDRNNTRNATYRIEYGQGDLSSFFANAIAIADCIQAFTSTGFQIGTNAIVNASSQLYEYVAIWMEP